MSNVSQLFFTWCLLHPKRASFRRRNPCTAYHRQRSSSWWRLRGLGRTFSMLLIWHHRLWPTHLRIPWILEKKKKVADTLFEKSNFCPKIQFWQNFTIFSWNQSCQQLKSANPQHFHEFFTWNFFDKFSREIKVVLQNPKPQHFHEFFTPPKKNRQFFWGKLNFWTKNEDFEQCAEVLKHRKGLKELEKSEITYIRLCRISCKWQSDDDPCIAWCSHRIRSPNT